MSYDPQCEAWICEQHPELNWPHPDEAESDGECAGPGMPLATQVRALVFQRDQATATLHDRVTREGTPND